MREVIYYIDYPKERRPAALTLKMCSTRNRLPQIIYCINYPGNVLHTLPVLYIFDVKYNYLADAVCARGNLLIPQLLPSFGVMVVRFTDDHYLDNLYSKLSRVICSCPFHG